MRRHAQFIGRFLRDSGGASAAEYALILSIVGTAIAASAFFLGQAIGEGIDRVASCIDTAGATCP